MPAPTEQPTHLPTSIPTLTLNPTLVPSPVPTYVPTPSPTAFVSIFNILTTRNVVIGAVFFVAVMMVSDVLVLYSFILFFCQFCSINSILHVTYHVMIYNLMLFGVPDYSLPCS
jgi:hypothetical protein